MSKELEALKELKHWKETNTENGVVWLPLFAVEDIEKALIKAQEQESKIEILKEYRKDYLDRLKNLEKHSQEQEKKNDRNKQLEEQIGCPLEIVIKALTNGVYVIDEETKELQYILRGLYTFTGEGLGTNSGFSDERVWRRKVNEAGTEFCPIYFWKDYKKTWWLKEDKTE